MKNKLCIECNKRNVFIKKREICMACYHRLARQGIIPPLPIKSSFEKRKTLVNNLKKKYGIEIFKDLNALDKKHFWNLTEMAKKYNLSRERTRQYYKIIKQRPFRKIKAGKTLQRRKDLACIYDPRRKVADYRNGSNLHKGAIAEKLFFEKCYALGYDIRFDKDLSVDLIVNEHRVDVKSATKSRYYSGNIEYFKYSCTGKQTKNANFFACHNKIDDSFYIVPNGILNEDKNGIISIYITPESGKYDKYKNAWDLLQYRTMLDLY